MADDRTSFELFAIIEHMGDTIDSGNYVAITKRNNKWFRFEKETFKQVSEEDAMAAEAYMLFYRKVANEL